MKQGGGSPLVVVVVKPSRMCVMRREGWGKGGADVGGCVESKLEHHCSLKLEGRQITVLSEGRPGGQLPAVYIGPLQGECMIIIYNPGLFLTFKFQMTE